MKLVSAFLIYFSLTLMSDSLVKCSERNAESEGVLINFQSQNETVSPSEPNRIVSSPGCPPSLDGIIKGSSAPYVYLHRSRCYPTGVQGTCPQGMKLSINPNSTLAGLCQCDCYFPSAENPDRVWRPLEKQRPFCYDQASGRHYTYVIEKTQCYPLLSQGPCENGQWLVLEPSTELPYCETRKCAKDGEFLDVYTNSCEMRDGPCDESEEANCSDFECKYLADESHWTPVCKSTGREKAPPDYHSGGTGRAV